MLELAKILVQTLSSGLRLSFELHALVAQWIERSPPERKAVGSTPIMYIHFTAAVLLPLFFVLSEIDV